MFFARNEIQFPPDLADSLSAALWKNDLSSENIRRQGVALQRLWERLAKRRGIVSAGETHYAFQKAEAEAYASYYLPANALKCALVLEEALLLGMNIVPEGKAARWLDLGTGPGTAFWGIAWWASRRKKLIEFSGWDQSPLFSEIAATLTARSPFGLRPQFISGSKCDALSLVKKLEPTHVSLMNSIAEIYPDPEKRFSETKKILNALNDFSRRDGRARYLLIVEPGSRESSRELAELKDRLQAELPVRAVLPCLDARLCGALSKQQDWCHEEVACLFPPWLNELGANAGLRKESILFSYVLLRTGIDEAMPGGLRIVSQRLERKGQVECFLCAPAGKIHARAQRSKAGPESAPIMDACRGDLWRSAELGEKGDLLKAEMVSPDELSVFS